MGSSLVDAALDGYNTVMFMYGQTSSGKTFTLFGDGHNEKGIVEHAMSQVHDRVTSSTDTGTQCVLVKEYFQIFFDLIRLYFPHFV
jgi:centromeric protein E